MTAREFLGLRPTHDPHRWVHALGRWADGNSLDNTIRIVDVVPSEGILCDIRVMAIRHGFGHTA